MPLISGATMASEDFACAVVDLNNWFKPFTNLQRAFKTQAERTTLADKTMASQAGEKAPEGEEDWKKGLKAPKKDDRVQTEVRRVEHRRRPPALVDEIAGRRAGVAARL